MKISVFLIIVTVLMFACEPRDPQVLSREEIQNQGRKNNSGNLNNNQGSNSQNSNQISWEQNFDLISAFMLSHELIRVPILPKFIDASINNLDKALGNQKCVQVSILPLSDNLIQGSIQFVNCFFSGDTSISLSGTLYFEKRSVGSDQTGFYKISTINGPLLYNIRGNRKLINLYYDLRAEVSLREDHIRTHGYQSIYHWTNSHGHSQTMRIDGLVRPIKDPGALVGHLAYQSNFGSSQGPLFDLNLESISFEKEQKDYSNVWCQQSNMATFKLRFDYKPPMRRDNAELRLGQNELIIKSLKSGDESDRIFKFEPLCQNRWISSELSWVINPALLFLE